MPFHHYTRKMFTIGLLTIQLGWAIPDASADTVNCNTQLEPEVITSPLLSVLTLNLAHGRKDSFNQMFQRTNKTRLNLEEIADFFSDSGADLVALGIDRINSFDERRLGRYEPALGG